jgi:membrane fusion protein (multidrug efflux system)
MRRIANSPVILTVSFLVISTLIFSGCKSKQSQEQQPPVLKVLELKSMNVPAYIDLVGQAEGIPTVEIRARVEGYLQNWDFDEGSIVKKGQLLFKIEQSQYINNVDYAQADLDSKTAAWEKAKLDVARLKPLLATNAISQNDYDVAVTTEKQTRAAVESARADLDQAKLNLSYTTITSPITGYIGKAMVRPGNLVGRGESTLLATISAVDPIYINFQLNEITYLSVMRYIAQTNDPDLLNKQPIYVYLKLADNLDYPERGVIDFMDRNINPQTGTIALRARVPNPNGIIKPGNFATVSLIFRHIDNLPVIPQSAVIDIQGKNFAFLVDNQNRVTRVPVLLGRNIGNRVVVLKGLVPGEKILLEGFQKFQEGMVVQPNIVKDTFSLPVRPE